MKKQNVNTIVQQSLSCIDTVCEQSLKMYKFLQIEYFLAYRLTDTATVTFFCYLQHLVGTGFDTGCHVGWGKCHLFHLLEVIFRILIQNKIACFNEWEFILWPNL